MKVTVLNDIDGELALIVQTIDIVEELGEEGTLSNGQVTSLVKVLENSVKKLEADQVSTAISMLEAFINKVNALFISGKIDGDLRDDLVDDVQEIIDTL